MFGSWRLFRQLSGGHWEHWILEDTFGIERWEWIKVKRCFRSYARMETAEQYKPKGAVPDIGPQRCETW